MALIFDNCGLYVESKCTMLEKIQAIDAIINALESQALTSAATSGLGEYQLNDGQTIIKQVYRGEVAIAMAIDSFERIRQRYINRFNGRTFRGLDSKNFRSKNGSQF